ncbi:hypothetical protein MBOE_29560 [Mycolicibacterium boenickei]|uniref:Uncharacterized protein n=1 Tax=Mycolicibacterium boenickei TaxID=146017 RepID=A0ABM7IWT3_9MYCO|nr:hypothetical protein MBOE_29560 [Mycolicibacterium boenickei]
MLAPPALGVSVCGTCGDAGSPDEQAANTGTIAAANTAKALALRDRGKAAVRTVTPCTVAATPMPYPDMPTDLDFQQRGHTAAGH